MYYFQIDWITRTKGNEDEIITENGVITLHLVADTKENALAQATKIAQGMSRAFNGTQTAFFYRILM
jgi:hypothetical protein